MIWSGPGGQGGAHIAALAGELGFAAKPGCAAFHLPATPNGRGVADAWAAAVGRRRGEPGADRAARSSRATRPRPTRTSARSPQDAEKVLAIGMFRRPLRGWTDLVLPGTSYLERDGTTINLEGRLQRLRRAVIPPCPDELAWLSRLGRALRGRALAATPRRSSRELSEVCYDGLEYGRVGERAPLPPRAEPAQAEEPVRKEPRPERLTGKGLKLVAYRPLFSGPDVERVPELQFQRPGRGGRGLGRRRRPARDRHRRPGRRHLERDLAEAEGPREQEAAQGRRAHPASTTRTSLAEPRRGQKAVTEPWWISLPKAFVIINVVLLMFAYLTWVERKVIGRMQRRYGPNRAGPFGLLQPIADLVKLIRKESFVPTHGIDVLYIGAPVVSAFTALARLRGDPVRARLGRARLPDRRLRRQRLDLADAAVRARLGRDLRLHRRRLGLGVEVLAARLDAHVRAARLVRGLAGAVGARDRAHGRVAVARRHRRRAAGCAGGTSSRRPSASSSS